MCKNQFQHILLFMVMLVLHLCAGPSSVSRGRQVSSVGERSVDVGESEPFLSPWFWHENHTILRTDVLSDITAMRDNLGVAFALKNLWCVEQIGFLYS